MRIAFITGGLPLGGSTLFMIFLTAALKKMGVEVEVFSFSASHPLAADFSKAGIPVYTQDESRLIYEDRLKNIYARLRAFGPTTVIGVLGMESFEILRYLPSNVLRTGIFLDRAINPPVVGPRYRHTLDHLIVIAAYLKREMQQLDPQWPCTHLALGIPIPQIAPRVMVSHSAPLRILYYGRLENFSKGVRLFPEIVAALKRRGIPFCWTIHGYGPEEEFLKEMLADEVRAGQVRFSSIIDYDQIPAFVRQHDVYLLSSTNEGGPLTLLESMALGLVPVCGDINGLVEDVITPENGFRVPRDNPDAYAQAIAILHADRELLERMSQAARATITTDFSAEAMAQRYSAFIESHSSPAKKVLWPEKIQVKPILGSNPFFQIGPMRVIRRMVKKFRKKS